jgi:hypothetical protein
LFEANRGLTYQEAASSINHKKEELAHVANNEKRSLTVSALIEEAGALLQRVERQGCELK